MVEKNETISGSQTRDGQVLTQQLNIVKQLLYIRAGRYFQ
jgi:hypothetical protein